MLRALAALPDSFASSARDIARRAGVAHTTAGRVLRSLAEQRIVRVQRVGRADLHQLNDQHVLAAQVRALFQSEASVRTQNDAALLLAIHSGISACDAVTAAFAGVRSSDPDHFKAADLLETVVRQSVEIHERANQLRGLLKMKNVLEYEDRRVSAPGADTATKRAERLARWAAAQLDRARL